MAGVCFPCRIFAGDSHEGGRGDEGVPVGNHGGVQRTQLLDECGVVFAVVGFGGVVAVGFGVIAVDFGVAVGGRLACGGKVGVAVMQGALGDAAGEGVRVGEVFGVAQAAQRVVYGFFEGGAVFVDLQAFVVAGFQRKFGQPALAQAVYGADEDFVEVFLQAFDAGKERDQAVQSAVFDGVGDEVAVDVVAAAGGGDGIEAGGKSGVVGQQGFVVEVAAGDGFQVFAQRVQALLDALLHFCRGLAGEGGGDDAAWLVAAFDEQAQDDAGEGPGFAGAGRGFNQGAAGERDGEGGCGHRGSRWEKARRMAGFFCGWGNQAAILPHCSAQSLQASRQALHSAWWSACALQASAHCLQASAQSLATAGSNAACCAARLLVASHSASIWLTALAQSPRLLSPSAKRRRQWARQARPAARHSAVALTSASCGLAAAAPWSW